VKLVLRILRFHVIHMSTRRLCLLLCSRKQVANTRLITISSTELSFLTLRQSYRSLHSDRVIDPYTPTELSFHTLRQSYRSLHSDRIIVPYTPTELSFLILRQSYRSLHCDRVIGSYAPLGARIDNSVEEIGLIFNGSCSGVLVPVRIFVMFLWLQNLGTTFIFKSNSHSKSMYTMSIKLLL
jgi:hypothetical protein